MKQLLLLKQFHSNRIKQVNINNIFQPFIHSYSSNFNKRYFSDDNHDVDNGMEKNKYIAPTLTGLTIEQIIKVSEKNNYLRTKHLEIEGNLNSHDKDVVRRKRMIYRSKQRGWLEADILLGSWAVLHVPSLSIEELDEYEIILNEETIDVFNYVTGKL
jgi:succinate dehydrogenase flavin-adding protein (antitoxin of CptAB toxin-antitoxin module)